MSIRRSSQVCTLLPHHFFPSVCRKTSPLSLPCPYKSWLFPHPFGVHACTHSHVYFSSFVLMNQVAFVYFCPPKVPLSMPISRVNQLDAAQVDEKNLSKMKDQLKSVFSFYVSVRVILRISLYMPQML